MKRALLSVYDKQGLVEFAAELKSLGYELISTGGTYKKLKSEGLPVIEIEEVTGFPECLDGRLKTLHPAVHGGILAMRRNPEHMRQIDEQNILPIDLVAVNLYPFKETIEKDDVTLELAIENIDIGGPTMLRSAAKNHNDVTVVVDPSDYKTIIEEVKTNGNTSLTTRFRLAQKVFAHTARYDSMISNYLYKQLNTDALPDSLTLTFDKVQEMRYGENPHQAASFYCDAIQPDCSIAKTKQLHGKELSFNNINDTHGALELLREFSEPTVVACKHSNPCGVASAETISEAFRKCYESDPTSIFGGIICCNREVDKLTADQIAKIVIEIVLAPSFTEDALTVLTKKKNIRLLTLEGIAKKAEKTALDLKKVSGGLLVQTIDSMLLPEGMAMAELNCVTMTKPTESELRDLLYAWKIVKHTKSNAIAIAKDSVSIGIGVGQVRRIWACEQAIEHGRVILGEASLTGACLASDAYFPFGDCVEAAHKAGITAIIQPGGSIRDQESIDLCNQYGISMLFTEMRHFRH